MYILYHKWAEQQLKKITTGNLHGWYKKEVIFLEKYSEIK